MQKVKKAMGGYAMKAKSGKSFPDLTGDGKVTKADILKGRGVIKNGGKMKKAKGGATLKPKGVTAANVSKRLGSRLRAGGTLSPTGSNVSRKLASPFKKKAKGGATLSPSNTSTSNRLASNLKMKKGGSVKKAMGGYKTMKMGGKCRGGCY